MSYILDALRRADAERGRGNVPGLNAQPVPAPESGPAAARPAVPWLAGAVVALAGGAIGWFFFGRAPEAAPPPPFSQAMPAAPMTVAPQPTPAPPPPPVAVAPSPLPLPPLAAQTAPPPVPIARAQPPAEPPAPAPEPVVEKPAAKPSAKAAAAAASAPPPAVPWNELPDEVKRQLPALSMGGAIWSEVPSARMLIVGGQLVREGDAVAPNVKLEQIKQRSAVLAWKGLRYEVPY